MNRILAVILLLAGACSASPYDFPVAQVMPDGQRGYSMTGYVQFTGSEDEARRSIEERFQRACGSPVRMVDLRMHRADSLIGAPHFYYEAVAACVS